MIIFLAWNSKIVPRPSYVTWCILTCNVPSRVPCANSVTEVKSVTWLSLFMLTTKEGPKSLFTLISFSFVTIIRLKPVKCSFFKGRNPRKVFVRINQTINPLSFPKHNGHPYRPACLHAKARVRTKSRTAVLFCTLYHPYNKLSNIFFEFLRVVQTQAISFLKSMSERAGSDIERLWILITSFSIEIHHSIPASLYVGSDPFRH